MSVAPLHAKREGHDLAPVAGADGDLHSARGRRILARAEAAMTVSRHDRPATAHASRAEQAKDARLRRALSLPRFEVGA